jgi:hypothetical protein
VTIVSSIIIEDSPQIDGRRWIRERHTDSLGVPHDRVYMAAAKFDTSTILTVDAASIDAQLTADEIAANIASVLAFGSQATLNFSYSTTVQNRSAIRGAYASATQLQAIMIGDFLNTLTDAQLQNVFGLTAGQVTTLRANKLTPAANTAAAIRATTGQ